MVKRKPEPGGQALKGWMEREKVTQAELARRLGARQEMVSRWVSGAHAPNLATAHAIEDVTGVPTESWLR